VVVEGLEACEALAPSAGAFLFAAMPTLAEVCLVPQLTNARRFGVDLSVYPRLLAAERACQELPAFTAAAPELQPDAEPG
jgi:maleylpyruvate isomerase